MLKYPLDVLVYFLMGPLLLLIPGAGFMIYKILRTKNTHLFHPLGWSFILIGLYAVALPAIYHHGRYLMPLIPIVIILGVEGLFHLLGNLPARSLLRPATWLCVAGMFMVLWANGVSIFALQVDLLNNSHMQAALWVDKHAPKEAVIATHDIGIIGYITQRQIVDLAGLVTPEVIPFMNDQTKLAQYVHARNVTYLIVFTGYYTDFLEQLNAQLVYSPNKRDLKTLGLEPFEVFQIPSP